MPALLTLLLACRPDAQEILDGLPPAALATAEDVAWWADTSAPALLLNAYSPLLAIEALEEQGEVDCPVGSQDGEVLTYTGGCTDNQGNTWEGVVQVGPEGIVYEGLALTTSAEDCPDGTTTLRLDGAVLGDSEAEPLAFSLELAMELSGLDSETCLPSGGRLAIVYSGTRVREGSAEVWSGTGRVGDEERGWVDSTTTEELLDESICAIQAASGHTTLTNGADVVVITYDGATDCDDAGEVPWTLNGEAMGTLSGVYCASAGGPASAWLGLLALGLGLRRRR